MSSAKAQSPRPGTDRALMSDKSCPLGRVPVDIGTYRQGLEDFLSVFDAHFDEVADTMLDTATMLPALGRLFPRSSLAQARLRLRDSHELVRRAILQTDWEPLLNLRREQGRQYAVSGVALEEVLEIFASFKELLVPYLVEAYGTDPARLIRVLNATDSYLRFTISEVLDAFVSSLSPAPRRRTRTGHLHS